MSALLQFKERYEIANVSGGPLAHPKTLSWKNSQDCCSWDGIECDENTGHVIVLDLGSSLLYGSIDNNSTIFQLAHLEKLNLGDNHFNYSQIPSRVGDLSRLTHLNLSASFFSGQVPSEIFKLTRLVYLNLCCNLDPHHDRLLLEMKAPGLRRLSQNLTSLEELLLGLVYMSSQVPNTLANLSSLRRLNIDGCDLHGVFPSAIFYLPKLRYLSVGGNEDLTGRLPNFNSSSPLEELQLFTTSFSGELPTSIGSIPASFANLSNLEYLDVGMNPFAAQSTSSLSWGEVPFWVWNGSFNSMQYLNLSHNSLTGLDRYYPINPLYMYTMDLSHNMLKGPPPEAPPSIVSYIVSNNKLTGALPPWICNLSSAITLDLSSNNLTDVLPDCLGNISESLMILNLKGNNFHGNIPEVSRRETQLMMIDLSDNKLQGNLPRSLANCKKLEFINVANNFIMDTFPSWLGSLPDLHVLILRSNKFHGVLERPKSSLSFPKLRILDLSINAFAGKLLVEFFQSLSAMKSDTGNFTYMHGDLYPSAWLMYTYYGDYDFSMTVIYKGLKQYYPKVLDVFTVIDLSNNSFEGEIPGAIGDLQGLHGLSLSNNFLTGHIPSSLGNLTVLESLDLSRNKLSGRIPQKLTKLTFLSSLNVSYNNLTGFVPRGAQFDTFTNNSFEGNLGLCGEFIPKKCRHLGYALGQPPTQYEEDLGLPIELDWKIVLMGYGSGLVIGVVIGNAFFSWKHVWIEENNRRRRWPSRRQPRRGRIS
ncbi:receptor-like protein 43 [Eucalyptus grandis]|uniref:receptor-like protein 43 n=1 Tax=Eucalyptus grandis TaxID=71139 RepID=UPI00192EC4AD|nr:receptor-like protein 43 [Eucalyptus grandis]